jgi:hypothetical protein
VRGRKNREGNLPSRVIALDASDSPLTAGAAARVGFQALGLQGSVDGPTPKALRGMAQRQLDRAHDGLTEEWRGGFYRGPARARRRLRGSGGDALRGRGVPSGGRAGRAVRRVLRARAAARLGTGAALARRPGRGPRAPRGLLDSRPRHGCRRSGASGPPTGHSDSSTPSGVGLERGTAQPPDTAEREVLERLATGATNKAIADELVISEKTVSVHVSDLLAELGVEKRGPTPPSPENWCPSRVTRNQVWTSQTFRPPPAAPQNRHAATSPVVAESAVHQQSTRLQRHGSQSLDCRHASLPLPVRSRPASTTASAHETFPHQPRPMSRSPARRRGRLDPVLSPVTRRKDCEDRLRNLMVMGCGWWARV